MLYDILYNPFALVFLSYGLGVLIAEAMKKMGLYSYFEGHNYMSDELTRKLGVLHFGWLIRHSFMGKFNQKLHYQGRPNIEKFATLKKEMTSAEINHLMGFYFLLIINIIFLFLPIKRWYILLFLLINIVFNLYLVFLQQYNKRRIDRLLNRFKT